MLMKAGHAKYSVSPCHTMEYFCNAMFAIVKMKALMIALSFVDS